MSEQKSGKITFGGGRFLELFWFLEWSDQFGNPKYTTFSLPSLFKVENWFPLSVWLCNKRFLSWGIFYVFLKILIKTVQVRGLKIIANDFSSPKTIKNIEWEIIYSNIKQVKLCLLELILPMSLFRTLFIRFIWNVVQCKLFFSTRI